MNPSRSACCASAIESRSAWLGATPAPTGDRSRTESFMSAVYRHPGDALELPYPAGTIANRPPAHARMVARMTKPKLTYFDAPVSRGEECRLALHLAGVEFEDDRIKGPDWPALKPTTPYGSVPV